MPLIRKSRETTHHATSIHFPVRRVETGESGNAAWDCVLSCEWSTVFDARSSAAPYPMLVLPPPISLNSKNYIQVDVAVVLNRNGELLGLGSILDDLEVVTKPLN